MLHEANQFMPLSKLELLFEVIFLVQALYQQTKRPYFYMAETATFQASMQG
jgi:hypothetical protein